MPTQPQFDSEWKQLRAHGMKSFPLEFEPELERAYIADFISHNLGGLQAMVVLAAAGATVGFAIFWAIRGLPAPMALSGQIGILALLILTALGQRTEFYRRRFRFFSTLGHLLGSMALVGLTDLAKPQSKLDAALLYFGFVVITVMLPATAQVRLNALLFAAMSFVTAALLTDISNKPQFWQLTLVLAFCVLAAGYSGIRIDFMQRLAFLNGRALRDERDWSDKLLHSIIPRKFSREILRAVTERKPVV